MRWRRRAVVYGVMLTIPFLLEDLLKGGPRMTTLICIKVTWGVVLAAFGVTLPYASVPTRARMFIALNFMCGFAPSAIAFVAGDHHTTYFAWLVAVPFCLVVFAQEEALAAIVGSVTCFLGAALIVLTAQTDVADQSQWLLCVGAVCGIAVYTAIRQRAHFLEEQQQSRARIQALDQLGDSEKRRAQAERMALVGQLAAEVAHEINNPLGFVTANLQFLEAELEHPTVSAEERKLVIGETHIGLKRIKHIVGDLNAFSREGNERTTEVDLHEVVSEAERMALARTKGRIGFLNQLPPDVRHVIGNRRHLAQVFLNLFLNSADALVACPQALRATTSYAAVSSSDAASKLISLPVSPARS